MSSAFSNAKPSSRVPGSFVKAVLSVPSDYCCSLASEITLGGHITTHTLPPLPRPESCALPQQCHIFCPAQGSRSLTSTAPPLSAQDTRAHQTLPAAVRMLDLKQATRCSGASHLPTAQVYSTDGGWGIKNSSKNFSRLALKAKLTMGVRAENKKRWLLWP